MSTTAASAPAHDPIVQLCCRAYHEARSAELDKGGNEYEASEKGREAYRNTMPCLTTYANIRDFIACVTYGMLCQVIRNDDATKLLYAAQVALGALRAQPKPKPDPPRTA